MGRESFEKRQREKQRQERAEAKRQRREERAELGPDESQPDAAALTERFRILSEQHAAGIIGDEAYEAERNAIFTQLGLATT